MSKTFDSFKRIEEINRKRAEAKAAAAKADKEKKTEKPLLLNPQKPKSRFSFSKLIVVILFIGLVALNVNTYLVLEQNSLKINTLLTTLNKYQEMLDENNSSFFGLAGKLRQVSDDLVQTDINIEWVDSKIDDLGNKVKEVSAVGKRMVKNQERLVNLEKDSYRKAFLMSEFTDKIDKLTSKIMSLNSEVVRLKKINYE